MNGVWPDLDPPRRAPKRSDWRFVRWIVAAIIFGAAVYLFFYLRAPVLA